MTDAQFVDFVTEMFWYLHEDGHRELRYIDTGVSDHLPHGEVQHGPWHRRDCSRVLRRWFDAGLIKVCFVEGWPVEIPPGLPRDQAQQILDHPETWEAEGEAAEKDGKCISVWPAVWQSEVSLWVRLEDWTRYVERTLFEAGS